MLRKYGDATCNHDYMAKDRLLHFWKTLRISCERRLTEHIPKDFMANVQSRNNTEGTPKRCISGLEEDSGLKWMTSPYSPIRNRHVGVETAFFGIDIIMANVSRNDRVAKLKQTHNLGPRIWSQLKIEDGRIDPLSVIA